MNYFINQKLKNTTSKTPRVSGIVLGDPVISFSYQYNNFGSFALARGLIDYNRMQKMSAYEASFILQSPTNANICKIHSSLYNLLRSTCPFNVELSDCMPESNSGKGDCNIFPLT